MAVSTVAPSTDSGRESALRPPSAKASDTTFGGLSWIFYTRSSSECSSRHGPEMEALRLKIDNLEREVERLTVEDSKLREDYPGASERLDREAELQKTKNDVAELTNRMEVLEQQLAEYKCGGGRGSQSWADVGTSSGDAVTRRRIRHGDKGVRGDRGTATDGPGEQGNHREKSADNLRVGTSLGRRRTAPKGGRGSSVATSRARMPPSTGGGTVLGGVGEAWETYLSHN